jgi:hypothetical protein
MDDLSTHSKEMLTRFGAAYFESEVLHRGLCITYALSSFKNIKSITRPRVEEKLRLAYSLTLGQVINTSKNLFPIDIQILLDLALAKRNYLAHHFLFEKNFLMFSNDGLIQLENELLEYSVFFDELDKRINLFIHPLIEEMGITDEKVDEVFALLKTGIQDNHLISQRKLKKQELVVRVWDVELSEGLVSQIFETEDGELWQLCDIGLGWSIISKQLYKWQINEKIQKYLPYVIIPRPKIDEEWNYKFPLSKGAIFCVKPGSEEKKYSWELIEA